mgnify:FL=1|jgi:hypothetical protein|tara:strand:+ start:1572 stop:2162 length:591 start_codon:yes stop_codon:yes gene_type:complete
MTINLLDDVAPASNSLGAVSDLAQKMFDTEKEIEDLEKLLKEKKQNLTKLAEQDLPDLMQELNMKDFTLNNGAKVEIQDIASGSIPSATAIMRAKPEDRPELELRQQQCFDWLRGNNAGDLIKSNVEVQFSKGEDKACNDFTEELRERNLFYRRAVGVHHGRLNSFIKEQLSDGKDVPHDLFKIYVGRKAKLTGGV